MGAGLDAVLRRAGRALHGLLLAGACGAAAAQAADGGGLREIAPGVYLCPGTHEPWGPANRRPVANGGFIVGTRCVAVIDPGGSPAEGRSLLDALRRVTPLPVCHVLNTHGHPDHVLGNAAFAAEPGTPAPDFVGHHRLPAALAARGPFYLSALQQEPGAGVARLVPPTRLVQDRLELDLGGRRLLLRAWPTAHTDSDLTVLDLQTGTLWLGDLLFEGHLPVLDGRLGGWLQLLAQLVHEPVRLAVPGHGAPGADWPAVLAPQRRYLRQLWQDTRAALRAQQPIEQAVERIAPDAAARWELVDEFHRRNVTAAYAELEWEDEKE